MRKNVWLATSLALVAGVLLLGEAAAQQVQPAPNEKGEVKKQDPQPPTQPGGIQLPQPPGGEKGPFPPGFDPKKGPFPPGFDPKKGPFPPGFDPEKGPFPPGFDPKKGPFPPGFDPKKGPFPPGYDPKKGPFPPGYDPKKGTPPPIGLPGDKGKGDVKESKFEAKTETFTYSKAGENELKVTVHYPKDWKAADKRSAIIFFADGDFSKAVNIDEFKYHANYLASRGMVAARAEYRTKKDGASVQDAIDDARNALKWVREKAGELGVNPEKVATGGGSAGALIALGTVTTAGKAKPDLMLMFNVPLNMAQFADKLGGQKIADNLSVERNVESLPPTVLFFRNDARTMPQVMPLLMQAVKGGLPIDIGVSSDNDAMFFTKSPNREAALAAADRFMSERGFLKGEPTVDGGSQAQVVLMAQQMKGKIPGRPDVNPGFDPDGGGLPPFPPGGQPPFPPGGKPAIPPGGKQGGQPGFPPPGGPPGVPPGFPPPGFPPEGAVPPGFNPPQGGPAQPGSRPPASPPGNRGAQ